MDFFGVPLAIIGNVSGWLVAVSVAIGAARLVVHMVSSGNWVPRSTVDTLIADRKTLLETVATQAEAIDRVTEGLQKVEALMRALPVPQSTQQQHQAHHRRGGR